jgi:hypothetical protein
MACRACRAATRQGYCFRRYRRSSMLRFEALRLQVRPISQWQFAGHWDAQSSPARSFLTLVGYAAPWHHSAYAGSSVMVEISNRQSLFAVRRYDLWRLPQPRFG